MLAGARACHEGLIRLLRQQRVRTCLADSTQTPHLALAAHESPGRLAQLANTGTMAWGG